MYSYTDAFIAKLISCPKVVVDPPSKEDYLERGSWRNGAQLKSKDNLEFTMFTRRLDALVEYFSIGLIFNPNDGTGQVTLLRCNSPHGDHTNLPTQDTHETAYHIHKATAEAIDAGLRSERYAEVTLVFGSFAEALDYFVNTVNIEDAGKHFKINKQLELPM